MINLNMLMRPLVLTLALAAALPAQAQGSFGLSTQSAEERTRAIVETTYFQALLRNFVESVRRDGGPACLRAKALDDTAIIARGQAIFQHYGVQMMKLLDEGFDQPAFEAALAASAGPDARAEIDRLKRDPDVVALLALNRPAELARAADRLVEQFDRYVLIRHIKLYPVGPVARGEPELKENPTEAADAAVDRYIDEHLTPQLERYAELIDASEAAAQKAIKRDVALKLGPAAYFGGVESDLAELCVVYRQR